MNSGFRSHFVHSTLADSCHRQVRMLYAFELNIYLRIIFALHFTVESTAFSIKLSNNIFVIDGIFTGNRYFDLLVPNRKCKLYRCGLLNHRIWMWAIDPSPRKLSTFHFSPPPQHTPTHTFRYLNLAMAKRFMWHVKTRQRHEFHFDIFSHSYLQLSEANDVPFISIFHMWKCPNPCDLSFRL